MESNEAERRRWNDERWCTAWPKRERLTGAVTSFLLEALAPTPSERIVDIGSGGGRATLAAAEAVGREGVLVGVDISDTLCRLARERAAAAGVGNVSFTVADAQSEALAGAPFDAVMSQFGVMFFDEPLVAFANIRGALRPGGRLAFACWQPAELNPWFFAQAVADYLPPPPEPAPGKSATGPFALADAAATRTLLERAGFRDVRRQAHELETEAPTDTVVDESQLAFMGVAEDVLAEAMDAVEVYMQRFRVDATTSRFPLAFQIFTAANP